MRPSVAPSVREHWVRTKKKPTFLNKIQELAEVWVGTSDRSPESVPPSDPTRGRYKQSNPRFDN